MVCGTKTSNGSSSSSVEQYDEVDAEVDAPQEEDDDDAMVESSLVCFLAFSYE